MKEAGAAGLAAPLRSFYDPFFSPVFPPHAAIKPASSASIFLRAATSAGGSLGRLGYMFLQCAVPSMNTEGCSGWLLFHRESACQGSTLPLTKIMREEAMDWPPMYAFCDGV